MLLLDPFLSVINLLPFSQCAPLLRLIEGIADCLWYAEIPNLSRIVRIRRCGIVGRFLYVVHLVSHVVRISFSSLNDCEGTCTITKCDNLYVSRVVVDDE